MRTQFIIFFIFFAISFHVYGQEQKKLSSIQNFVLENLEGDLIELENEIGEGPIILNFWATWCKPCKEELKELNKIYNKYSDQGLKLFAISVDSEKSIAKVKPYIKTNQFDFTVLLDYNSEVARMYYAQMVPYSVIIDLNGEIIYTQLGYKRGDEVKMENIIADLIDI